MASSKLQRTRVDSVLAVFNVLESHLHLLITDGR